MADKEREAWMCGPIEGVLPHLMPAAHALVQAAIDIERAVGTLTPTEIWKQPNGAPSIGFHLRHVAGSIDRLLTYAHGKSLTGEQLAALGDERLSGDPPTGATTLLHGAVKSIEMALYVIRTTTEESLFNARVVGRERLPTNVFGLLFHIAEHTQRHTGQIITTAKVAGATTNY